MSVLLNEVIAYLAPKDGGIYVDCNLGLGGHSAAILEASSPGGKVIGFDWDAEALEIAQKKLFIYGSRVQLMRRNFATIQSSLQELGVGSVDGILLDLGLSSLQLDGGDRGFSFKGSQALDMRMDDRQEETAAHLVNTASEEELADIFFYYGEERQARPISAAIIEYRRSQAIATNDQLVKIVEQAVPKRFHPKKIHPATKVFQGLRIAVNDELQNLSKVLVDGTGLLKINGVFCVISFHSLEDRMVKRFFADEPKLKVLTKKPVVPTDEECRLNHRARSAKLRVAVFAGNN